MASGSDQPLIVIVGPTASGKSNLAIKLAQNINGEIICADSRTVYKYMNIGTAKPTFEDRQKVPHWGLDLVEPAERFTVFDFKNYALKKIDEIKNRGKIPILVGGSGLYIDSVILDYNFVAQESRIKRDKLESMSLEQLHEYCEKNNIILPENEKNKRYVIRAIERKGNMQSRKHKPDDDMIVVGITTDKNILKMRIDARVEQMFKDGVVDEAKNLGQKYGWDSESMTGNVYRTVKGYLSGDFDIEQAKEKTKSLDRKLVKKQLTWLRRNSFIVWQNLDEAGEYILNQLAKLRSS